MWSYAPIRSVPVGSVLPQQTGPIVEFTDYQCGFCRRFDNQTFPQLKKEFIDTGKVRFISMDLPLDSYDLARYCTVDIPFYRTFLRTVPPKPPDQHGGREL
ncbi:MAG: hypothetical protein DMG57_42890 [Acidobacteria bacterium]|nr:MAG: hypothetical protein DMG57_42890 [Acidobacteriota bacterium]